MGVDGSASDKAGSGPGALRGARIEGRDLTGARFVGCDLSGVRMRGVEVRGLTIDSPWLLEGDDPLLVNGVDVRPFVDAELDRRFPGRELREASDPAGLRDAWAALERAWAGTLDRVAAMPPGTTDERVEGEWSFAETLRHLVMATDTWLGRAVLERGFEEAYHPIGVAHTEFAEDGYDPAIFAESAPAYARVLEVRADRVAMVRDFLASVTPAQLAQQRRNPWGPDYPETVLSCLHTILGEEWEHHRYAVRDLDVIERRASAG